MINLHIYPSSITHENRILRATTSIAKNFKRKVIIFGTHEVGLKKREKLNDKNEIWRLTNRKKNQNSFEKLFFMLKFYLDVIISSNGLRVQTINIHSLSLLPLGFILKVLNNSYLIYDTHELETETHQLKGFRKKLSKLMESCLINYVDGCVFVNKSIEIWYKEQYGPKIKKSCVIENTPNFFKIEDNDLFREKFKIKKNTKIFLYQGSLSHGRGVEQMISFFKHTEKNICLVLMGFGPLVELCQAASIESNRIFYHKAVDPTILNKYTTSADFGINLIDPICLSYKLCLPNKFFEYIFSGLPVISSDLTEVQNIFKNYNLGVISKSLMVPDIDEALAKILIADFKNFSYDVQSLEKQRSWPAQEKKLINFMRGFLST